MTELASSEPAIGAPRSATCLDPASNEAQFRLLIESVKDFAMGRVSTWNKGAECIKGYRPDEIIGRHFSQFYPPEEVARGKPQQPSIGARPSTSRREDRIMPEESADILLVEDNPNDVKLTLHAFKEANLANRVHVVRDGVEALEYLFGPGPDDGQKILGNPKLILLDLKLPRLDGHEVLKRIKGDPRTSRIPVVVLTSSSEERDVMRTYDVGVNSYIVKPVDFEQFTESVRDIGKYWLVINHTGG
jgi:two-component system response regulator